jgi:hypothetical protein
LLTSSYTLSRHAKRYMARIYSLLILLVAGGMTVRGCVLEQSHAGADLRVYCALQYCTGLVLCAIALLINVTGKGKQ